AGGNLAAAVTLQARDGGGPDLAGQLLVYPNTNYHAETPSLRDNADPCFFNSSSVDWYWKHYLTDPADGADPLCSPLRAETLKGLPPALVITAEYDPLRDEGEQYAARLERDGVPTRLSRYDGMIHGFFAMSGALDDGARAMAEAAEFLRATFAAGRAGEGDR
ncbi:MAG: alpha/beta hydrolase, partial [Actinocatenispora sp.]